MKIIYFAKIRELIGKSEEEISFPSNVKKIEDLIKKNHPYETPFLVQLETKKVNSEYILWARKNT